MFDEQTLLGEIINVWGPHGAHADLFKWMIQEITDLRIAGDELADQVGELPLNSFTEALPVVKCLKNWKEIRNV